MAFDYDTDPTGKFRLAGKLIAKLNSYKATAATTYPADLAAIQTLFGAAGLSANVASLTGNYAAFQNGIRAIRAVLAGKVDGVFKAQDVLDEFGLPNASAVWNAIFNQMVSDAKTVQANAVTLGTVTATGGNVGTAKVLLTKVLDGVNKPGANYPLLPGYVGRNSELAVSETMTFRATSPTVLRWSGGDPAIKLSHLSEGSGTGPTLPIAVGNANNKLVNGSIDNWTNPTTPATWTKTGTVAQESTTVLRMGSSLKVAAGNTGTLVQTLSRALQGKRCYCVTAWARKSAVGGTGNVTLGLTGTGLTLLAGATITQAVSGLSNTAWTLLSAFIVTPAVLPSDIAFSVSMNPGTVDVYVDEVCVQEVKYHGGVGAAAVGGDTDVVAGDSWTAANTNNNAGVFQRFMREWYGVQMPSAASSPAISDSLAT